MVANFNNLQQQIDTHRTILDSIAEGIIVADKNGCFLFFNSVAADMLGIGAKQVTPAEWTSVYGCYDMDGKTPYPPERLPLAKALQGQFAQDQLLIRNHNRPQGVYIDISANPLKDTNGTVTGGMVIFRDITPDIHAKQLLKESRERAKAQFKGVPIPTFIWKHIDNDFILLECNHAAESFLTNDISDYLGAKLSDMYANHPDVQADFERCYKEHITFNREVSHFFKGVGQQKDLILTYVYIEPDLVMVHTEDVTDRKKAENELKRYFNAVEQTADMVMITDTNGVIEYVNPAFEEITGYSRKEAAGNRPSILRSGRHDKDFYKNMWGTILEGKPFQDTLVNRKKNGELFWCEQTISSMRDSYDNISHFVCVAKDVTQLKEKQQMEFRLKVAHELQQRLAKAITLVPGFDIAGKTYSAVETSGDFFDIIDMPDGYIGIVIGDVVGHGIGAAMIMAETRAYLRAISRYEKDPSVILERLNSELVIDLQSEHFVTLVLARIHPQERSLVYASAGHNKSYLLHNSGSVHIEMASTGIPLGFLKDTEYEKSEPHDLLPGSILVLLTDGITEAHSTDRVQFGDSRALEVVRQHRENPAQDIIKNLYYEVCSFSQKKTQDDDMTAVICKVNQLD